MTPGTDALRACAARLLGCPPDGLTATALPGGRNNRVYRLGHPDGTPFLLKAYYHSPDDPRDRLGTEFGFLTFCWDHGIRCVPRPIAADRARHVGVYEYLDGRRLDASDVDTARVDDALDFWEVLQRHRDSAAARELPPASEAALNPATQLALVARRLDLLASLPADGTLEREALAFVRDHLRPAWLALRDRMERDAAAAGRDPTRTVTADLRLSPSDFGFHNALATTDRGLCFVDFEYAGWDDPAKTVGDFFCQEQVPVPESYLPRVIDRVTAGCLDAAAARTRILRALPVCRLAWCCIYLNEFRADPWRRRQFAGTAGPARDDAKRRQLDRARRMHQLIRTSLEEDPL